MKRRFFIKSIFALSTMAYVIKYYKGSFRNTSLPNYATKHKIGYSMECAVSDSNGNILKQINMENNSIEKTLFDMSLVDRYFVQNKELLLFASTK